MLNFSLLDDINKRVQLDSYEEASSFARSLLEIDNYVDVLCEHGVLTHSTFRPPQVLSDAAGLLDNTDLASLDAIESNALENILRTNFCGDM